MVRISFSMLRSPIYRTVPGAKCRSSPSRAASSAGSITLSGEIRPCSCAKRVTPRYIAPESRYRKSKCVAISLASVLLPVEE